MEALIREMLDGRILLAEAIGEFEKIYIEQALERNGGRLMRTADELGIHRNTLSAKLSIYKDAEAASARSHKRTGSKKKAANAKAKVRAAGT